MSHDNENAIRSQLVKSLRGGNAFESFDEIIKQIPAESRFIVPANRGHSAWEIVEHMHRSIVDLVEFIDNSDGSYQEKSWPDDYWPTRDADADPAEWDRSLEGFRSGQSRIEELLLDENRDLTKAFPWGQGQALLHEVLLAIEHNAYHCGELVEVTIMLGG